VSIVDRAVEERQRADYSGYPYALESTTDYESVTRSELAKADRTLPLPEDLRLATEYLLNPRGRYFSSREFSQSTDGSPMYVFASQITDKVLPLKKALDARFQRDRSYPTNETILRMLLAEAGLNPDEFRDPWDNRFQFRFETRSSTSVVLGVSAGPDKVMGNEDDFTPIAWSWPYFQKRGEILKLAVNRYQESNRVFVRDIETLRKALQREGEDLDQWMDPWGRAYRFEFGVSGSNFSITCDHGGYGRNLFFKGKIFLGRRSGSQCHIRLRVSRFGGTFKMLSDASIAKPVLIRRQSFRFSKRFGRRRSPIPN
jgi:hypothetical protein